MHMFQLTTQLPLGQQQKSVLFMLLVILAHKAPWLMTSYGCGLPGTPLKGPSEALLWTVLAKKGQHVDL